MWPLIACHSPHWNNPLFISCMIRKFSVTFSLALNNSEGKNILKLLAIIKSNLLIPIIFGRFTFKFLKITRLLDKIKNTISLRFISSISFPCKKLSSERTCAIYWLLIVCTMKWASWPRYLYIYGPDSGDVALTCSSLFLCPTLLGIVFHVSLLQEFWDGKGEIKYPASRAFFPARTLYESFVWQTFTSLGLLFTWHFYVRMYCMPTATLNQKRQSQLLYLGNVQIISNYLAWLRR